MALESQLKKHSAQVAETKHPGKRQTTETYGDTDEENNIL
jgi:hypothetical protein